MNRCLDDLTNKQKKMVDACKIDLKSHERDVKVNEKFSLSCQSIETIFLTVQNITLHTNGSKITTIAL